MTESLRRFINSLDRAKPHLTTEQQTLAPGVEDIADMLWLAAQIAAHTPPAEVDETDSEKPLATESFEPSHTTPELPSTPSTPTPASNTESLGVLSTQPPTPLPQESSEDSAKSSQKLS